MKVEAVCLFFLAEGANDLSGLAATSGTGMK